MGSIYKKGQHWYIRFDVPRTLDGRRQQVAQACPGLSKKQAEHQLREIECQVARGTWQAPRQLQVGPFMDVWLSHIRGGSRGFNVRQL